MNDGADALDFFLSPVQILDPLVYRQIRLQQFEIAGHDADGISDFVRDAGRQAPHRGELLRPDDLRLGLLQFSVGRLQ